MLRLQKRSIWGEQHAFAPQIGEPIPIDAKNKARHMQIAKPKTLQPKPKSCSIPSCLQRKTNQNRTNTTLPPIT
ncbi:hypothetical protein EUGRSUZ_C03300 [Eucalyptus grandis]|uniref:Uncharacterized protein n=2 Tax=Eucalyptus grandis TaxID=71139 RepID=A0ACC3LI58_EUCGR|nr:hypothetical protein EUGRSUZ_C03300 [Eucalyptus grandis]